MTSRAIQVCTWLLCCVASLSLAGSPYGLDAPSPVSAYLGGSFPDEPPGSSSQWEVVNAYPNLTFIDPLALVEWPGENEYLVVTLNGEIWSIDATDPNTSTKTLFLDITDRVKVTEEAGLMNLVFHPEFGQPGSPNRGYVYLWYQHSPEVARPEAYLRLSRFTVPDGWTTADPASEFVLVQQYDRHHWHAGGGLFFGTDGYLYFSVGDEGGHPGGAYQSSQTVDQGLFGGLFRIDVDMNSTTSHAIRRQPVDATTPPPGWVNSYTQGYMIPNDNPFLDPGGGLLEEYFALGLRNPHRVTQDAILGEIWAGDVGQGSLEEIDVVESGGNYQWPYMEGTLPGPETMPDPLTGTEKDPIHVYPRSQGISVIGGFVYRGSRFDVQLGGKYLFADTGSGNVWTLERNGSSADVQFLALVPQAGGGFAGVSSFATDSTGEVFILQVMGFGLDGGKILKLNPKDPTPEPPQWLSQTGAFSDLVTLTPSSGIVPYRVNAPLWSDHAAKDRFIALPNDGTHDSPGELIQSSSFEDWTFPSGTVFIKHFELPVDARDSSSVTRLETRFFVIDKDGGAYGVTYKWNDQQTDAELLPGTDTRLVTIFDETGTPSDQLWTFPSRSDCMSCHTAGSGYVRGVSAAQLNGDFEYESTGRTDNQLRTWNHLGMLSPPLTESDIARMPKSDAVTMPTYDLAHRVRSYVDSNCSHCHRPNGVNALFDARYETPLALQEIVDGALVGDYGDPAARVVKRQDVARSIALTRMQSEGPDLMPPIGRSVPHDRALDALEQWVLDLGPADPLCDRQALPIPDEVTVLNSVDSEQAGFEATFAIDGDSQTFWLTDSADSLPHEMVVDLGAAYDLSGLVLMPRQDGTFVGGVDTYEVYGSLDAIQWNSPVATGTLSRTTSEQRIDFSTNARYIRVVALTEVDGGSRTSIAELNVLKAPCSGDCSASQPGAIANLSVISLGNGDTELTWTASPLVGVSYDVLRSSEPRHFVEISCVEKRDVDTIAIETTSPAPGAAFFYEVRGVNECNGDTGPLSNGSDGQPRDSETCF